MTTKRPTRMEATLSANSKRMKRNEARMTSSKGDLEMLKKLPSGKAANEPWSKQATRKRVSVK